MTEEELIAFRDSLHVPPDVPEEYLEDIVEILDRIPKGWGKWISMSAGWYPIIVELNRKLAELDPGYEVHQVKEKFGCYDEETSVLTRSGWKLFKELNYEDELATLREGILVYESPVDLISYSYSGRMYSLNTRGVDLLVTPNHNLYVAYGTYYSGADKTAPKGQQGCKRTDFPFGLSTAEDQFGARKRFLKGAAWEGGHQTEFILPADDKTRTLKDGSEGRTYFHPEVIFPMEPWLKFLGWYIAEGSSSKDGLDTSISFNNTDGGDEFLRIQQIIENLGVRYSLSGLDRPAGTFRIYNVQIGRWLIEHCGKGSHEKRIPEFVKDLSPEQIELLLVELFAGDGHKTPTAHILTTVSQQLVYGVEELILKSGYAFRTYEVRPPKPGFLTTEGRVITGGPHYDVNWLQITDHQVPKNSDKETWKQYDGMVYCATVPSGVLYVKRNGKGVWCGNSLRYYFGLSPLPELPCCVLFDAEHPYPRRSWPTADPKADEYRAEFDAFAELHDAHWQTEEHIAAWDAQEPLRQAQHALSKVMYDLTTEAERLSMKTCEICGLEGTLCHRPSGWLQTLCPACTLRTRM